MLLTKVIKNILTICALLVATTHSEVIFGKLDANENLKNDATDIYFNIRGNEQRLDENGAYMRLKIPRSIFNIDAPVSTDCIRWICYTETGTNSFGPGEKPLSVNWLYPTSKLYPYYAYAAKTLSIYVQHYYSTPYFREEEVEGAGIYQQEVYITDAIMKSYTKSQNDSNSQLQTGGWKSYLVHQSSRVWESVKSIFDRSITNKELKKISYNPSEHKVVVHTALLATNKGYEGIKYLNLFINDSASLDEISNAMTLVIIPSIRRIFREWSWFGDGTFAGITQIITNKYTEAVYVNWPLMQFLGFMKADIMQKIEEILQAADIKNRELKVEKLRAIYSAVDAAIAVESFNYYYSYGQIPMTMMRLGLITFFMGLNSTVDGLAWSKAAQLAGASPQMVALAKAGGTAWGTMTGVVSGLTKGYLVDKGVGAVIKTASGKSSETKTEKPDSQTISI